MGREIVTLAFQEAVHQVVEQPLVIRFVEPDPVRVESRLERQLRQLQIEACPSLRRDDHFAVDDEVRG